MANILDGDYEKRVDLERLSTHPRNPRRGHVGKLEQLIEDNGFHGALLVQRSTGFILAGNHRMQGARAAGLTALPVIWLDVDDDEALRILLGDNAGADAASYDDLQLAELLSELEASDRALAGTGYSSAELEALLDRLGADVAPAGATDPDEAPPKPGPEAIVSQLGEVWLLGRHRLVVGDSRDPLVVERALNGRPADMVWTDPPYGVKYVGGSRAEAEGTTREGIEGDDLSLEELAALLRAALGNARTWSRPGASWWVAGPSGPPSAPVFAEVLGELKVWRYTVVWVKDTFVIGRQDYHHRHELLYEGDAPDLELGSAQVDLSSLEPELLAAGWKPGAKHRPPRDRKQDNVWEVPRPRASKDHPTMKPVALVERAVRNHSEPGEVVLDVFAGSGTTLIACHRAGRAACLVEKDPGYADVILRRWHAHTGVAPRRGDDGSEVSFL